jgi:hypothetical protein
MSLLLPCQEIRIVEKNEKEKLNGLQVFQGPNCSSMLNLDGPSGPHTSTSLIISQFKASTNL